MTSYLSETVGRIAAANPASARIFETLGIDYCCGGKLTLEAACERAAVPLDRVLSLLHEPDGANSRQAARDWTDAPLGDLIAHIVSKHHGFVRAETPRLQALLAKVTARHGSAHPEVPEIRDLFMALAQELQSHLMREERVLFPYIEGHEAVSVGGQPPAACFGSVELPIARMVADHDDAGELLARIRELSRGYAAPQSACMSFQALYRGLAGFEEDLHLHIHLENNILFPRAIALERKGLS